MCGISGFILNPSTSVPFDTYKKCIINSNNALNHRGPDQNGLWINTGKNVTALAHTRLAIQDLSPTGKQPMHSHCNRYVISFNGEIYNYKHLRKELCNLGIIFKSNTDTEVLVEGYAVWGLELLVKIRGMFAIALYDKYLSEMLLAVDPVGKKPLLYSNQHDGLFFSSELQSLLMFPIVGKAVDYEACALMMLHNLRQIPQPFTGYKNIYKIEPGSYLMYKDSKITSCNQYWKPSASLVGPNIDSDIRNKIEECVSLRMISDVPICALLSGGVDSTIIVSLMSRYSDSQINTYAIGRDDDDVEIQRARAVAAYFNTNHKEIFFNSEDTWNSLKQVILSYGEPIMLLPMCFMEILARQIKSDNFKVVMTGNGADEIFYGYHGHLQSSRISKISSVLNSAIGILSGNLFDCSIELKNIFVSIKPWRYKFAAHALKHGVLNSSIRFSKLQVLIDRLTAYGRLCPQNSFIDVSNYQNLFIENTHSLTTSADMSFMLHGIEARSPFLDESLINLAFSMNAKLKIPKAIPKYLKYALKQSVLDLVPPSVLNASKKGFGNSIQEEYLLKTFWKDRVNEIFYSIPKSGPLWNRSKLLSLWNMFIDGRPVPASLFAKALSIELWLQNIK